MARVAADLGTSTSRTRRLALTALPAGFARSATAATRVLLVEGPTDRAVLAVLLAGREGTVVLDVGGKHLLPFAAALVRGLGGSPHVLLDGDAEGWRRADNPARARTTHRRSTDAVLAQLRGTGATVLVDDLEAELAQWPSFVAALEGAGGALRVKDPARYATAAREADPADLPPVLRALATTPTWH